MSTYLDSRSVNVLLSTYTPEIINFITASVSLTVRLPTVFIHTSTQISILFSFMLFIANCNILIRCLFHQLLTTENAIYDAIGMQVTDMIIFLCTVFNYSLIYEMVRTRYIDKFFEARLDSSGQSSPKSAISSNRTPKIARVWPNVLSTSLLIISVILNIDQYRLSSWKEPLIFVDLSIVVVHYLYWLIIVLLLTFKTDWHFEFPSIARKGSLLGRATSPPSHNLGLKQTEPIYTCFQQLEGVRSVSSESSRTPNQDFSSASSSSGSHTSERVLSYKHIPSISYQLDPPDLNFDDLPTYKNAGRQAKNLLQEITEENLDQIGYFKSPNVSQRSSNIHSSDSGIGINYKEHVEYGMSVRSPNYETPISRSLSLQRHGLHEYNINEELHGPMNMCSDV